MVVVDNSKTPNELDGAYTNENPPPYDRTTAVVYQPIGITVDDPPLADLPLALYPSPPPPPNVQRSNYLSISRVNTSLKGAWIVDNSLRIPRLVLPPLRPGELERKNLRLECQNGSINADVWVVRGKSSVGSGEGLKKGKERVSIDVRDQNGGLTVKIRRPDEGVPIHLTCFNQNGRTNVYIPWTFCGPAKFINSNSQLIFSDHLSPHVMTFSDSNGTLHTFIGDYSSVDWDGESETWEGDELSIEGRNGRVYVYFVDEPQEEKGPGLFEKYFPGFGR